MNPALTIALILAALIIADFFIPMLPSATMIATLAGLLVGDAVLIAALIAWAAAASWAGDRIGYHALRHARARMRTPILNSAKVTRLEIRLRETLRRRPCTTTIVARFLPAGRTALAWTAVATPDYRHAGMSAVAAGAWASCTVGVGLLIASVFGAGWLSAATTVTAVAAMTMVLGWWFSKARMSRPGEVGRPLPSLIGGGPPDGGPGHTPLAMFGRTAAAVLPRVIGTGSADRNAPRAAGLSCQRSPEGLAPLSNRTTSGFAGTVSSSYVRSAPRRRSVRRGR
ncbi:hypothetical protein K3N28_08895 [Glycomyces sp. TRM65418]|nr:hypothetical protein [Glycomyces sp. TRM65418]MCC3763186.1 hypothetical protein [Glycomyces sp. TRM65418]QZD57191.1 hypothetical protein K3N28_08835 [Glycomyces sp. TRM65418]